jgi:hypothetical protein
MRVEVRSSLAAAHRECRERVLEHLFEGEELEDAKRDGSMEPQATLVRPERAVHLHAEAAIHLDVAAIVLPGHPEHDHALGFRDSLEDAGPRQLRAARDDKIDAFEEFFDGLVEIRFGRVLGSDQVKDVADVRGEGAAR